VAQYWLQIVAHFALQFNTLLWGSDWPCTNHEQFGHFETLIAQAHEWIYAQALEQVIVHNPTQLYGFTR
jgi:predicted TIM-barrel fold metal-dependent hydrolase